MIRKVIEELKLVRPIRIFRHEEAFTIQEKRGFPVRITYNKDNFHPNKLKALVFPRHYKNYLLEETQLAHYRLPILEHYASIHPYRGNRVISGSFIVETPTNYGPYTLYFSYLEDLLVPSEHHRVESYKRITYD